MLKPVNGNNLELLLDGNHATKKNVNNTKHFSCRIKHFICFESHSRSLNVRYCSAVNISTQHHHSFKFIAAINRSPL